MSAHELGIGRRMVRRAIRVVTTVLVIGAAIGLDASPAHAVGSLSIADVSLSEGAGTFSFTVTLSPSNPTEVQVTATTSAGTATAGTDYTHKTQVLTFAAGETSKTFDVAVAADTVVEAAETFTVTLSDPTLGTTIGDGTGVGTINNDDGNITIADVSQAEGTSGAGDTTFSFTVSVSGTTETAVGFSYATAAGSATAATDYDTASATSSIPSGSTSVTVPINVNKDALAEPNETFTVTLSSPTTTGTTITDDTGLGTIQNDDGPVPSFSVDDPSVVEGNAATATTTFTVTLSPTVNQATTVAYATASGTATSGTDFTAAAGTLSFAANEPTQTVTVDAIGDTLDEVNETFSLVLSSPTNAAVSATDGSGTATITDDDAAPAISIADPAVASEGAGTLNFTVSLDAASGQSVTVNYATAAGTATAGSDYTTASGTVTFVPGDTSETIGVTLIDDAFDEEDSETFVVDLSTPSNATLADGQATGTISDNESVPELTVNDVTVVEGSSGSTDATFTVTLSPPSNRTATVAYTATAGTAASGTDFTATSGTLTFSAGQTSKPVTVPVLGDVLDEGVSEAYTLELSGAVNSSIADGSGAGTITDDDDPPTISILDQTVDEGNSGTAAASFTVLLSAASGQTVTVNASSGDGTATGGTDYGSITNQVVTIAAGSLSTPVTIDVYGDTVDEDNETYTMTLSSASGATILDGSATGTITDDDDAPTVSIADVSELELSGLGTTTFTFTAALSAASEKTITIDYATADGTSVSGAARAGTDFTAASGVLTYTAGQTSKTITVDVLRDLVNEPDEVFTLALSNLTNVTGADTSAVGTIRNEDGPHPLATIGDVTVTEGTLGVTNATFTVSLSTSSSDTTSVDYATSGGTATSGSDFAATSGTLSIPAGNTSGTISVPVTTDTRDEGTETFTLTLSNPDNLAISDTSATGTITDDDDAPTISISDPSIAEGDAGTTTLSYLVTLSNPSASTVTVGYATSAGTAEVTDFTAASGTLTFTPDDVSETVSVTVVSDTTDEVDETVFVDLATPTNASILDGHGIGTILDDDALPMLSFSDDVTVDEATSTATFTVTLSQASEKTVTVGYATSNGTATAGSDYTAASGTLTFVPGDTVETFTVTVAEDALDEADETLIATLSSESNAVIADGSATGTITDNDATPTMAFVVDGVSIAEGDSGPSSLTFTVDLSAPSGRIVTVDYATADGTAAAGADYTATSGTLTFAPGDTSETITIPVLGDTTDEVDETLLLNLSGAAHATVTSSAATGTITDDDGEPVLSIADASVAEGDSGSASLTFTVALSPASGKTVTVGAATAAVTATAGADYTTTAATLTFAPGETSKSFTVPVAGDTTDEVDESLLVGLSGATFALIGDSSGAGTITDDDAAPSLSVDDVAVSEGDAGSVSATFTVSLSAASAKTVTVDAATSAGTATAGVDYTAAAATLTFVPGDTSETFTVTVAGDTTDEVDETFDVVLSGLTNASVADSSGVGTITDDDAAPSVAVDDVTVVEGNSGTVAATFTATLSAASGKTVTVDYATANGTATAGADYTAASGTLTFTPGDTSETVTVTVAGDTTDEVDETYSVVLSGVANASIADGSGAGTITDDDGEPVLSIADASVAEGDSGSASLTFTVALSPASGKTVTVDAATAAVTATAGADYTTTAATLTFAPGETSKSFTVPVLGDTTDEVDESLLANLSGATFASIADSSGAGTITDDDAAPSLSVDDVTVVEGNSGSTDAVFTVTLDAASEKTVTVDAATSAVTATAGADYTAAASTLTFVPGDTSETFTVTVNGDTTAEVDEAYSVELSNPGNVTISDGSGAGTITDDDSAGTFAAVTTRKVLDKTLGAGKTAVVDVTGVGGVPTSGVGSVVLQVSAIGPTASGVVTVAPGTSTTIRSLELVPGRSTSNQVVSKVGADGNVRVRNSAGTTLVVVYLVGWHAKSSVQPPASHFTAVRQAKVLDQAIGDSKTVGVTVTGVGGVPSSGVTAVVLNVSARKATKSTYLAVAPEAGAHPRMVEVKAGSTASNLVTVKVGSGGKVRVFNNDGVTDVEVSVVGWYATAGTRTGSTYRPGSGSQILDRVVGSSTTIRLDVTGVGGIPSSGVDAVVLNLRVMGPTANSFLSVMAEASPLRRCVELDSPYADGNLVVVPVGSLGSIRLRTGAGSARVQARVVGYYI